MTKLFLKVSAILSLTVFGSCSLVETVPAESEVGEMTVIAVIDDTKTSNEGASTKWTQGDKASLIHCQTGHSTYYASCFTYGSDGQFTGNVTNKYDSNDWFFAYPYSSANTSPKAISVHIDSAPTQKGNDSSAHLCGESFPIFGLRTGVPSAETPVISTSNSLAVGKIIVTNKLKETITVQKIKFASSSSISGDFTVDISAGSPVWTSKEDSDNSVTLTVNDGTPISSNGSASFYMGFVPHTSTQMSVTVTALTAGGKTVKYYASRESGGTDKFKAGYFKTIKLNFDDSHPVPTGYIKITEAPTDWSGTYLFVDETQGKAFAALPDVTDNAVSVSIKDGKIASDGKIDIYALHVTSTGKTHPAINNSPAYDVCNDEGKYIYWSSNKGGLVLDDNDIYENHPSNKNKDTQYSHCFQYSSGGVQVMAAGMVSGFSKYYLGYSSGAFSYNKTSTKVQLYKYVGEARKKQSLSFSSESIIWDLGSQYEMGGTYSVQEVEGAYTSVTYSSKNSGVATVSGKSITITGYGSTEITATAEADEEYNTASASYTLTISKEGLYNLENQYVMAYMDEAGEQYTDSNYKTLTIVTQYCGNQSATNRKDTPAPVTLSWTSSSNASKNVNIYNDASMTDLEMTATTSSNTVDIYNLIPGRKYWYSVSTASSNIASGTFETDGRRRMLLISNTRAKGHGNNCRDIGGLTTTDGKKLKYGIIFRGSNLDMTTDEEKSIIIDYMNVGIDIDLRSDTASYTSTGEDGIATDNNPWTGTWASKVTYNNDGAFSGTFSSDFKVGLKEKNAKFKAMFTQLLNTIKTGKSAYLHCHVGADRTGYVCMILEMALGVSPKDCSIDFELTSFSVTGNRLRTGDSTHNMFKDAMNYINDYEGNSYKEKAYNILTGYGITDAQIQEFRSIMLE